MDKYGWVLLLCCLILVVAVVTLSVLTYAKHNKTTQYLSPSFADLFQQMGNTDNIALVDPKPFRITSDQVVTPSKDAFVVENTSSDTQVASVFSLLGFAFTCSTPVTITSFQIMARSVFLTTHIARNIALFERNSQTMLGMSVVDPAISPIDTSGLFYTSFLDQPISLQTNVEYVLVAQSVPIDLLLLPSAQRGTAFTSPIQFVSGAETIDSSVMAFPSLFPANTSLFASFQFRLTSVAATTVFGVETANGGFASSPFQYLNGYIASVPGSGSFVLVQAGAASDSMQNVSIVLNEPIKILANQSGINGLDVGELIADMWYYLYVISSDQSALPTACILSRGRVAPQQMPANYVYFRRIGSVRASSPTTFHSMQQENLGRRRTTFWTGDSTLRNFVDAGVSENMLLPATVAFVPPTAIGMSVGVGGIIQTALPSPTETPINAIVQFRAMLQTKKTTLGIPNDVATYGQIDVPLNNSYLPQTVEYQLLPKPGTGGSIPNDVSPFQRFVIDCTVVKYVEIL